MTSDRSALYLDFDNIFGGLLAADWRAAIRFANRPGPWLEALKTSGDADRRWLVLRCYMNNGGSVVHPDPAAGTDRLYFSRFRAAFGRAGFELVDCPPVAGGKNAADIRMAIDAMDALGSGLYDEFVIASGDSDMTPLLVRLRAADKRTTVMTTFPTSESYAAIADQHLGIDDVIALLPDGEDQLEPMSQVPARKSSGRQVVRTVVVGADRDVTGLSDFDRFRMQVEARYTAASRPLLHVALGAELQRDLGPIVAETGWFGHRTFVAAVRALNLPSAGVSALFLWDRTRHPTPLKAPEVWHTNLPDRVATSMAAGHLPQWLPEQTVRVIALLADYAANNSLHIHAASAWVRDHFADRIDLSRVVTTDVARSLKNTDLNLGTTPPPALDVVLSAYVRFVVTQSFGQPISDADVEVFRRWLTGDQDQPPTTSETEGETPSEGEALVPAS